MMNIDHLNRHARVQCRTFCYAVSDLFTSLFVILAILVLYPFVFVWERI